MKNEKMLKALGSISDELIEEANIQNYTKLRYLRKTETPGVRQKTSVWSRSCADCRSAGRYRTGRGAVPAL